MKITTFSVDSDEELDGPKVHYAFILQEEDYEDEDEDEDEDVRGFTTHEYASADWQTRVDVQGWDPHDLNFFRI